MIDTRPSNRRVKAAAPAPAKTAMPPQRTESREALQSAPSSVATNNGNEPTTEEIAALAYQLWIERGSPHGSHEEDWHRAEAQLRSRQTLKRTPSASLTKTAGA